MICTLESVARSGGTWTRTVDSPAGGETVAMIGGDDPDVGTVVAVLDGTEGAWDRAQLGRRQAASGDTIILDEL